MKKMTMVAGFLLMIPVLAMAQNVRPMWRAELPGGSYDVALASISSVSTHEYVVSRAVRVFELTIGTNSSVEARFYFVEPLKVKTPDGVGQGVVDNIQDKLQQGVQRATGETNEPLLNGVVKDYPTTTHAHTVEYRIASRDDVTKMFKSIELAWRTNQDTTYKP